MSEPVPLLRRPWVYRTAIGLYLLVVLAVAGVTFAVNNVDVQGALYARADSDLEPGRTHGLRGVLHYAPTGEVVIPETMSWELRASDDGASYPLDFIGPPPAKAWPNPTFRIGDDIPPGAYDLHIQASHRHIAELQASFPVTVGESPRWATTFKELPWPRRQAREERASRRDRPVTYLGDGEPQVSLALIPRDGEVVRGMPQTLYLRVFDPHTGEPRRATLQVKLEEGLVEQELSPRIRADELGIAALELQPSTSLTLHVEVRPAPLNGDGDEEFQPQEPSTFRLKLPSVATQYSLQTTAPVVAPGEPIHAAAYGVLPDGYFMVDLLDHQGDRLLDSASLMMTDGQSGVRFDAPAAGESSRLVRLQSYQSIYGTRFGWDSAYVIIGDDAPHQLRWLAGDLLAWIADLTGDPHWAALADEDRLDDLSQAQLRDVLRAALRELPRRFEMPPVVLNTREEDRRALEAWRDEAKSDLQWMMGLTLFVGLIVFFYLVVVGLRRNLLEGAILREFELAEGELPPEQVQRAARLERLTVTLQGMIVVCTLVIFALGILMMVTHL